MVEIKKTTLSVDFPVVNQFADYHELDDFACQLTKLFGRKVGFYEVGLCANDRWYWGMFYVGRKPAKAVIDKLMADAGYESYGSW